MACGCPVLLSHAASLPEVGGPESEGAVRYFDPGSETEVASAIEGFLALDAGAREAMGQKALDRASRFSWESIAEKVVGAMASI
jgi:glycosyltransferase involved in cell wall biosynthesis